MKFLDFYDIPIYCNKIEKSLEFVFVYILFG